MDITVLLRMNPDLSEELELLDNKSDIDREWIGLMLNWFDDQALEQAIILKEKTGAHITAFALDGEGVDRMLKTALARGVDTVRKITRTESNKQTSRNLADAYVDAITQSKSDLILTGVLSTDDIFGELAPIVGAKLGIPQLSAVSHLEIKNGKIYARQEYSGGTAAIIETSMPAIIGLQAAENPPRYVSGSKLRDLLKTEISELECTNTVDSSFTENIRYSFPEKSNTVQMIPGTAEEVALKIYNILVKEGLL